MSIAFTNSGTAMSTTTPAAAHAALTDVIMFVVVRLYESPLVPARTLTEGERGCSVGAGGGSV